MYAILSFSVLEGGTRWAGKAPDGELRGSLIGRLVLTSRVSHKSEEAGTPVASFWLVSPRRNVCCWRKKKQAKIADKVKYFLSQASNEDDGLLRICWHEFNEVNVETKVLKTVLGKGSRG